MVRDSACNSQRLFFDADPGGRKRGRSKQLDEFTDQDHRSLLLSTNSEPRAAVENYKSEIRDKNIINTHILSAIAQNYDDEHHQQGIRLLGLDHVGG